MDKCLEFKNERFGTMEVIVGDGEMYFPENFIRKILNVKNKELPLACDSVTNEGTALIYLYELFEYIRYAKVTKETIWVFEEWIADIIKDCSKLL